MTQPKPLVAGNWKMNGIKASLNEVTAMADQLQSIKIGCEVMICPPASLLISMADFCQESPIKVGGQDCHTAQSGAHTGDISASMIKDCGGEAVIIGHSERRADHGETDELVKAKAQAAHEAGLMAIICVGETLAQRKAGKAIAIVGEQLRGSLPDTANAANLVVAYEPVWAIGSGLTPSVEEVAEVHAALRGELQDILGQDEAGQVRILYGGSVKPANAVELMAIAHVDGALVGGASLKADDFLGIISAYKQT